MDPQAPASFIPKKTLNQMPPRSGVGIFVTLCVLIFILSLAAAAAAFGYEHYLQISIASKADALQQNLTALNSSAVNDLIRLDSRMTQAKNLLQRHVAPSSIFSFLSQQTLQNVQFTSFQYKLQSNGSAELDLEGVADSFSTVALQSDQFGANRLLKDIIFSNLNTNQAGQVVFAVKMTAAPALLLYSQNIGGMPISTQPPQGQLPASTTLPIYVSTSTATSTSTH